jgi:hypothetical protein
MSSMKTLVLYVIAVGAFGVVVLWAQEAPPAAFAMLGVAVAIGLAAFVAAAWRRRRVLVVGDMDAEVERLESALERDGYEVETCPGPDGRPCPVLMGRDCPVTDRPLAALIVRDGARGPYPPCARALGIADVTVDEHSHAEAAFVGTSARVGLADGPEPVIDAMEALVGTPA